MLLLVAIGIVMIYSASGVMADYQYGSASLFFRKQIIWVLLGGFSMLVFSYMNYEKLRGFVIPLLVLTAFLLISVLIFGTTVGGAKRWLRLGPLGFQPSEAAKLVVVVYLAWYIDRRKSRMKNFKDGIVKPFVVVGIIIGLIFLEKDIGTPLLIFLITTILLFIGGIRLLHVCLAFVTAVPFIVYAILKEPYRLKRIAAFINPWADPQGSGYQLIQSMIAMGSGGIFGKGLGSSNIKMLFLPSPHTDFIFPIIGEEGGLLFTMLVLGLFILLFYYGMQVALNAKDLFGSILAFGITIMITLQALLNMSVSVGLLPTKGLPLPFISFGGSSVFMMLTGIGILLNIGKQLKNNANTRV